MRAFQQIVKTSKDAQAFRKLLLATGERKITYIPSIDNNTLTVGLFHRIHNQRPGHVSDYSTVGEALEKVRSALVRRSELEAAKAQEQHQGQEAEQEEEQQPGPAKRTRHGTQQLLQSSEGRAESQSANKRKADEAKLRQGGNKANKKTKSR